MSWDAALKRELAPGESAPSLLRRLLRWKDALTFLLTAVAFLSVAANVEQADWVRGLPSLYPIGLSALLTAYALSRLRVHQLLLLPLGLLAGSTILFLQMMAIIPGPTLYVRTDHLLDRMYAWWSAVTQSGISIDPLPVIVIMLVATWLGSFLAAWAIFRWRNPLLGLAPGAAALAWDAAFSPGEFSITSVIYLFAAVLLIMRIYVARQERRWDENGVDYPDFISLSVLHATFWVTFVLLALVWVLPLGQTSAAGNRRWDALTSPIADNLGPVARAFIAINPDKGAKVHALKDALALQGAINPQLAPAAQVQVTLPDDIAPFLRAQSFDQYQRNGWQVGTQNDTPLAAGDQTAAATVDAPPAGDGSAPVPRDVITARVTVQGGNGDQLFSVGQPLSSDQDAVAVAGNSAADVTNVRPAARLANGATYTVTGSVAAATEDELRAAGVSYPAWVTQTYLQLSGRLPARVGARAQELTSGATNPYDAATMIETYLRGFPIDYNVPQTPHNRDAVDYFLFDLQRGYFDYQASAMTVMLRTLGIPARMASGYVLDPAQRQADGTYRLTQQQAFAWPEAYFPGIGWVEFNPTADQPRVPRPASSQTATFDQTAPPPNLGITPPPPTAPAPSPAAGSPRPDSWLIAMMATLGAVVLAAAAGAVAWQRPLRGLPLPARLWESSLRVAALSGARPHAHETPREFAARLQHDVPGAAPLAVIAETYERTRFGNKRWSEDEARRLRTAWSAARRSLLRHAVPFRQRPPDI